MSTIRMTETGLAEVQQRFAVYGRDLVGRVTRQVWEKRLPQAVQYARATYLTGGTTSTRLAERTGRLKQSFDYAIQGQQLVTAHIGYLNNPPPWASVHEGWPGNRASTTIRPRSSRYLAIPLGEAQRGKRPRDYDETFVQQSRAGSLLIFRKLGNGGIEPLFLLKNQVVVPARPALAPTVRRFAPLIAQDLRELMGRNLRG